MGMKLSSCKLLFMKRGAGCSVFKTSTYVEIMLLPKFLYAKYSIEDSDKKESKKLEFCFER